MNFAGILVALKKVKRGDFKTIYEAAMRIQEMTLNECLKTLAQVSIGRLACARDGQPYVVPVYLTFDGKYFYGFSTLGQKIEWMRANPLVAVEIDDIKSQDQWISMVVFGSYEELADTPAYSAARTQAHNLLQQRAEWWQPAFVADAHPDHRESIKPIFFRISLNRITGRRASPNSIDEAYVQPITSRSWLRRLVSRVIAKG